MRHVIVRHSSTIVLFLLLIVATCQHAVLEDEDPEDQTVLEDEEAEESMATVKPVDGADEPELLVPDMHALCSAQLTDHLICFGSSTTSPSETWTTGHGCFNEVTDFCDTIVLMDLLMFPSFVKYTILLPVLVDSDEEHLSTRSYRLYLTPSSAWSGYSAVFDGEERPLGAKEDEVWDTDVQYFQIFRNSSSTAISRSITDAVHESRPPSEENGISEPGFVFPVTGEEGNGELVHDETSGKFYERFTAYSGSKILMGWIRSDHNQTLPLFLDMERDEIILHLDKRLIGESEEPLDRADSWIQSVVQSPVLRLFQEPNDESADSPTRTPTDSTLAMIHSVTVIDVLMLVVILALVSVIFACHTRRQNDAMCHWKKWYRQTISRCSFPQRTSGLISESA